MNSFEEKINALHRIAIEIPAVIIVHDLFTNSVEYMSPQGLQDIGKTLEEVKQMGAGYFQAFFNPQDLEDYLPKLVDLINNDTENKTTTFFQQVRPTPEHDWVWHLSACKVFMRDENGKPTHVITSASAIDPRHHVSVKAKRILEENNFLRKNQVVFASLTKREKEILRLMALGESAAEIADQLHISEKTAVTHKRNIKLKLNAHSNYEVTRFAQAFDLI